MSTETTAMRNEPRPTSSPMTGGNRSWQLSFRVVLVVTWVQILSAILLPNRFVPKPVLGFSYWWLRVVATLALLVLLYEFRQVATKRAPKMGLLIDALLVGPMYLLWWLISLFSSARI
jgi:hypothetical protein